MTVNYCPVSPLKLLEDFCETIMAAARTGVGVNVLSLEISGASTQVHLVGTPVVHNTEVLSGLVLNQLVSRGAPFVYRSSTTTMNLRIATASVGTPECAAISAAVARLARYYALPSFVAGGQGDSKLGDARSGNEKTITGLMTALAGPMLCRVWA